MRVAMCAFLFMLIAFKASAPQAFEVDGFRSGMTRNELIDAAKGMSLEAIDDKPGSMYLFTASRKTYFGSITLCRDKLVSYTRTIDFDVDFFPMLQSLLEKYGQPSKTRAGFTPWTGTGGGNIYNANLNWKSGDDGIALVFTPEGRDGQGNTKYSRSAAISHSSKNACWPLD